MAVGWWKWERRICYITRKPIQRAVREYHRASRRYGKLLIEEWLDEMEEELVYKEGE